jgi:hypothetical protein
LPERALFAILHKYQVFEHHFSTYVFFATDGIAIGHVIVSMFVGCIVAVAAKGREMVATVMLSLVLGGLCGVAILVTMAWARPLFLWVLPWYLADWFAIVIGGAIVRARRSAATPLPSAA